MRRKGYDVAEGELGGKGCFIQTMRSLPKVGPNAFGSLKGIFRRLRMSAFEAYLRPS